MASTWPRPFVRRKARLARGPLSGLADAVGLQAMARRLPMTRGYVVYLGDRVVRLADGIWALPIGRLMGRPIHQA
ncbi:MAG: hypothetical protein LBV06_08180 [Propionibacteriaceae bacterium]|nr:hypothetical protein [Propionibacteriaceae bacterium]